MPHTKRVFDEFEQYVIPKLKGHGCRSMLYVGWRRDCKPWWHDHMAKELGGPLGVLEIFMKNADDLEHEIWSGRYDVGSIIVGDARDPGSSLVKGYWDVIFWDHGPEHVTKEELYEATPKLLDHAGKALVYCCPWGHWPQGPEDGNEHEIHRFDVSDRDFLNMGFSTATFGKPGQDGEGELVGMILK